MKPEPLIRQVSALDQRWPFEMVVPADYLENHPGLDLADYLGLQLLREPKEMRHWIRQRYVLMNGQPARYSDPPEAGARLQITPPQLRQPTACAENTPLERVYEDEDLVIVNKPTGMATHPSSGWWQGSCVSALLFHIREWPGIKGVAGPGIVHRLDKNTSGLLVFAKTHYAQQRLIEALQSRRMIRRYLAVTGPYDGPSQGTWRYALEPDPGHGLKSRVTSPEPGVHKPGVKDATTHYQVVLRQPHQTVFSLQLETGRTHQIRVHLQAAGAPVLSDGLYGVATDKPMALHAYALQLPHPLSFALMEFKRWPLWLRDYGLDPQQIQQQLENLPDAGAPCAEGHF